MGVSYDIHQLRYLNSNKTLYVQIPAEKIDAVVEHVRKHLGWGEISTGTFPSNDDEQDDDQTSLLLLGLRMPEGHKRGVEKNDVINAARRKGIELATADFDLEFFNARNYKIRVADEKLANDLRHQANFVIHGVDVFITSWRKNRYQEYYAVTVANIGPNINRTELVRLVSAYAGEPAMSATHLKDDFGMVRPVSIIGFLTPQGQAKALNLNGPPSPTTRSIHQPPNSRPPNHTNTPTPYQNQGRRNEWAEEVNHSKSPAPSPTTNETSSTRNAKKNGHRAPARPSKGATQPSAGDNKLPSATRNTGRLENTWRRTTPQPSATNAPLLPLHTKRLNKVYITLLIFALLALYPTPTLASIDNQTSHNTPQRYDHLNITFTYCTHNYVPPLPPVTRKLKQKRNKPLVTTPTHHTTHTRWSYALALLILIPLIPGTEATIHNLDYNTVPPTVSTTLLAMGTAVLKIVTININRKPTSLFIIDHLMNKNNWDIVLVQETGIIKNNQNSHRGPTHQSIIKRLTNHITFNSPNQSQLNAKRTTRKSKIIKDNFNKGHISKEQFDMQMTFLPNDNADPAGGLAIMCRPELSTQIQHHKVLKPSNSNPLAKNKRIMAASMRISNQNVVLLNIYGPAKSNNKKSRWFTHKLQPEVKEITDKGWGVIIGGDFNVARTPMDKWFSGTVQHKTVTGLENMIQSIALHDVWREEHPNTIEFTYTKLAACPKEIQRKGADPCNLANLPTCILQRINKSLPKTDQRALTTTCPNIYQKLVKHTIWSSRIDLFATRDITPITTQIDQSGSIPSDHSPVVATFEIQRNHTKLPTSYRSTRRYNSGKLEDTTYRSAFQSFVQERIDPIHSNTNHTPKEKIMLVTHAAQQWCDSNIRLAAGPKHRRNRELGEQRKYIKKMVKTHRHVAHAMALETRPTISEAMRKLSTAPDWAAVPLPTSLDRASLLGYLNKINSKKAMANKKLKQESNSRKTAHNKDRFTKAFTIHRTDPKLFWRLLGSQRKKPKNITAAIQNVDGNRTLVRTQEGIMNAFYSFWANLYSHSAPPPLETPWFKHTRNMDNPESLTLPISPDEYSRALKNSRQGAPGTDGLDTNILAALPDQAHNILREAMSKILNEAAGIPDEWKVARMTLLPKEGSPHDPANYRPISLLQVSYKIFTAIITHRLARAVDPHVLSPNQMGFRKGIAPTTPLRVVIDAIEEANLSNKELHITFVDCKKAFDSIKHPAITEALSRYGASEKFIRVIQEIYSDCNSHFTINGIQSPNFNVERGVRQGDTLSPLLFLLTINPLLEWINADTQG